MTCQERSGFLFSHDCDLPAIASCEKCARRICSAHQRFANGRSMCISCERALGRTEEDRDDPYFYADTHFPGWSRWEESDYRAFDASAAAAAAAGTDRETGGATGDFESDIDGT